MAKLDEFDPFAGATSPVAPSAGGATEKPAEPPTAPPATPEPRKGGKGRQRASQPHPEVTQPDADPVVAPPPALTVAELAMRTHWLNATAGKLGRTLTGPTGAVAAAQAWQQAVTDARTAGVGDFPIMAAAMRALGQAPDAVAAVVAALADVPEMQRAIVQAVGRALGRDADDGDGWLHE